MSSATDILIINFLSKNGNNFYERNDWRNVSKLLVFQFYVRFCPAFLSFESTFDYDSTNMIILSAPISFFCILDWDFLSGFVCFWPRFDKSNVSYNDNNNDGTLTFGFFKGIDYCSHYYKSWVARDRFFETTVNYVMAPWHFIWLQFSIKRKLTSWEQKRQKRANIDIWFDIFKIHILIFAPIFMVFSKVKSIYSAFWTEFS